MNSGSTLEACWLPREEEQLLVESTVEWEPHAIQGVEIDGQDPASWCEQEHSTFFRSNSWWISQVLQREGRVGSQRHWWSSATRAGAARPIRPVWPWPDHFSRWSGRIYIWPDHFLVESNSGVSTQIQISNAEKGKLYITDGFGFSFCVPWDHKRKKVYKLHPILTCYGSLYNSI